MTEKAIKKLVLKYGGTVSQQLAIELPKTLHIAKKSEVLDILDILINNQDDEENTYTIYDFNIPLISIREAVQRGWQ